MEMPMKENKKPFGVRLPEKLIKKLRMLAATSGETIETLVAEAISNYLKGTRKKAKTPR